MKKLLILLLLAMVLVGCQENPEPSTPTETPIVLTTFEKVKHVIDNLDLGVDQGDVRHNLVLPKVILYSETEQVLVSWRSNLRSIINDEGHVNRPKAGDGTKTVILTATFRMGGTEDYKEFILSVPELPSGDMGLVEEATNNLVLIPGNTIDRDFLILPRVGEFGTYIEWISSNIEVIDLEGNVNLPLFGEPDKTVIMSATISKGQAMMFRDFQITVKASDATHGAPITLQDERIIRVRPVSDKIAFIAALLNAEPGDAIVLENGNYYDVNMTVTRSGTKEHPIFIMARNPGDAKIMGESQLYVKANHVVVAHLTFTNGRPTTDRGAIWLEGDYLRLTNTLIYRFEEEGMDYKWISLTGKYHEIDNNTFDGKETGGALLTIWRDDLSPQYHHIHHNQFKNYKDAGGANGYETIRVGTSHYSQNDAYVTIEHNLFEAVNGEIEIISIKAGRVHVRNNTFINSLGHITARHGKNSVIENNVFFAGNLVDTGGVRAYDGGHIIRNNYMDSVNTGSNTRGGIVIHSGVNEIGTNTVLNAQWTSFNMLIERNTIVNSRQSILFDGKYSLPTHDVIIKDNFIVAASGQPVVRYDKIPVNPIFINNYMYSNVGYAGGGAVATVNVPQGVTFSNQLPTLVANNQGLLLHATYGAQNLTRVTSLNSGVSWLRSN